MVVCPVCKKENNDNKYCTDCGTKLVDVEENQIFEFDKNSDLSNIDELNSYFKELNEKIDKQKKFLDELNNDPLIKKYETVSKINDENKKLKMRIEELEQNEEKLSSDLRKQRKMNSQLQAENDDLKNGGNIAGVIKGIFGGNNKSVSNANFCPNCGHKLS